MEEMRKILEAINMEVGGIMADWSDPRSECREILRLTAQALALSSPHPEAREEDIEAIRLAVNTINAYINDGRPLPPKGDPYYGADEAIDKILAALSRLAAQKDEGHDALAAFMVSQIEWSSRTFGPASRTNGILKHIAKELAEIEASPRDLSEWIDVVILALDGYWRHGGQPETIMRDLNAKAAINRGRTYAVPMSEDEPCEHVRETALAETKGE